MTVGEAMRKAREKAGVTLSELSRKSGVAYVSIQGWEVGRTSPNLLGAELCADVLGISIDEYVGHITKEPEETEAEIKQRNQKETLRAAINTFGIPRQEDIAIEEMSELTKAIIKNRRTPDKSHKDDIREEIADVFIMITQLKMIYGGDIEEIIDKKIKRLQLRLEDNSYER